MAISMSGRDDPVKAAKVSVYVNSSHPLIKLAKVLPWGQLMDLVSEDLKKTTAKGCWKSGRPLLLRMHLAVYILQKMFNKKDREIAQDLMTAVTKANSSIRFGADDDDANDTNSPLPKTQQIPYLVALDMVRIIQEELVRQDQAKKLPPMAIFGI